MASSKQRPLDGRNVTQSSAAEEVVEEESADERRRRTNQSSRHWSISCFSVLPGKVDWRQFAVAREDSRRKRRKRRQRRRYAAGCFGGDTVWREQFPHDSSVWEQLAGCSVCSTFSRCSLKPNIATRTTIRFTHSGIVENRTAGCSRPGSSSSSHQQWVSEWISQSASEWVNESVNQSVSQSLSERVGEWISEPFSQSLSEPFSQSLSEWVSEWVCLPISAPVSHSTSERVSLSVNQ